MELEVKKASGRDEVLRCHAQSLEEELSGSVPSDDSWHVLYHAALADLEHERELTAAAKSEREQLQKSLQAEKARFAEMEKSKLHWQSECRNLEDDIVKARNQRDSYTLKLEDENADIKSSLKKFKKISAYLGIALSLLVLLFLYIFVPAFLRNYF